MDIGTWLAIILIPILFGVVIYQGYTIKELPTVPKPQPAIVEWLTGSLQQIFLYLPNAVFFFGFMSDIVNQELNKSIASISGLLGLILTFLLGKVKLPTKANIVATTIASPELPGGPLTSEPPDTNPFRGGGNPIFCSIPGFSMLETDLAPQSLVLTTSILFYYMLSEWINNPSQSISLSVTAGTVLLAQIVSLFMNDCLVPFRFSETSKAIPIILALVLGVGYGGITYAIWEKVIVPKIQSTGSPISGSLKSTQPIGSLSKKSQEVKIGSPGEQVSADLEDGDYELVGELFKDGELITSSIVD